MHAACQNVIAIKIHTGICLTPYKYYNVKLLIVVKLWHNYKKKTISKDGFSYVNKIFLKNYNQDSKNKFSNFMIWFYLELCFLGGALLPLILEPFPAGS